jgi:hypothetical protein
VTVRWIRRDRLYHVVAVDLKSVARTDALKSEFAKLPELANNIRQYPTEEALDASSSGF